MTLVVLLIRDIHLRHKRVILSLNAQLLDVKKINDNI